MNKKLALLLLFPVCLFSTIEVSTKIDPPKEEVAQTPLQELADTSTETMHELEEPMDDSDNDSDIMMQSPLYKNESTQKQFFRILVFLCILIVFGLIVLYVYKRGAPISTLKKRNGKNNIKILERRSLSPQTYLYHIEVGDKQFILSESKVEVRCVSTLDWPERK